MLGTWKNISVLCKMDECRERRFYKCVSTLNLKELLDEYIGWIRQPKTISERARLTRGSCLLSSCHTNIPTQPPSFSISLIIVCAICNRSISDLYH